MKDEIGIKKERQRQRGFVVSEIARIWDLPTNGCNHMMYPMACSFLKNYCCDFIVGCFSKIKDKRKKGAPQDEVWAFLRGILNRESEKRDPIYEDLEVRNLV